MPERNIFIAKRAGKRTHVFLRAYKKEALEHLDYSFSAGSLDALLLAQDPESFVSAVKSFHPLSLKPLCKREFGKSPRKVTVGEFKSHYINDYETIDESVLMEEYTGLKENEELNKSSLKRSTKDFDALRGDRFLNFLRDDGFTAGDFVISEPVLDWCAAKAIISNIVLFQAFLSGEAQDLDFDETMTHNGFWIFGHPFDQQTKDRIKQFIYAPGWKNDGSLLKETIVDFDSSTYAENSGWISGFLKDFTIKLELKNSKYFQLKSANQISGKALPTRSKKRSQVIDRSLYLTAPVGCSERELAADFVGAVLATMKDYRAFGKKGSQTGDSLGWEFDYESAIDQLPSPALKFYSQGAQLIYDTAFHSPEIRATVCKNCGRPMINQLGAKPRQFCRASCRTMFSNRHRAVKNNG